MTPPDKDKINRVIAEAMGWTHIGYAAEEPGRLMGHPPNGKSMELCNLPNPYDSISDAFEAWEKLIKQPYWGILMQPFEGHLWTFTVRYEAEDITASRIVTSAEAETLSAAVSLALVKYIKEM